MLGGTEENHKKPKSGQLVSWLRLKPGNSQIQSKRKIFTCKVSGSVQFLLAIVH